MSNNLYKWSCKTHKNTEKLSTYIVSWSSNLVSRNRRLYLKIFWEKRGFKKIKKGVRSVCSYHVVKNVTITKPWREIDRYFNNHGLIMILTVESRVIIYQHTSIPAFLLVSKNEKPKQKEKNCQRILISVSSLQIKKKQNAAMKWNILNLWLLSWLICAPTILQSWAHNEKQRHKKASEYMIIAQK